MRSSKSSAENHVHWRRKTTFGRVFAGVLPDFADSNTRMNIKVSKRQPLVIISESLLNYENTHSKCKFNPQDSKYNSHRVTSSKTRLSGAAQHHHQTQPPSEREGSLYAPVCVCVKLRERVHLT